jgi:hypothetical protein
MNSACEGNKAEKKVATNVKNLNRSKQEKRDEEK